MQKRLKSVAHKTVSCFTAFVLACGLTAFPAGGVSRAVADDDLTAGVWNPQEVSTPESYSTSQVIAAASYRAAEPAPEILGLSNVGTNTAWQGVGELDWSAPYYYIFGTEYNTSPNPYMVNAVANKQNGDNAASPSMVFYNRSGGPTAAMYAYKSGNDSGSDLVWEMKPEVIFGTGDSSESNLYQNANYLGELYSTYNYQPTGVKYDTTNIYTMIDSMYSLAAAADAADSANSSKSLRYGSATDIAKQYETYVRGTIGYVLQQLNVEGKSKKTVALVSNYNSSADTYTLTKTGVAEGTAASNRLLEAVQPVATNVADAMPAGSSGDVTISKDELAKVDLILLGSQTGTEKITSTEGILDTFTTDMQNKTYWVNSSTGSAGSTYGVVMNSVENAQNIGRVLGCLYNEYINQDQWICYYYDNFYHLKTSALQEVVANAMDGVRNWDAAKGSNYSALTVWEESDAADYDERAVQDKLDAGMKYIVAMSDTSHTVIPQYLDVATVGGLSETYASTLKDAVITVTDSSDIIYNGNAKTPAFTMKLSSSASETALEVNASGEVTKGGDTYSVKYLNNKDAGQATIYVYETATPANTKTAQFTIKADETSKSSDEITADAIAAVTYNGSKQTPEVTGVKLGSTPLSAGDYTIAYSDNLNAGTAKVTITVPNYNKTKEINFTINKASDIKVASVDPQTYTGNAITPKPAVSIGADGKGGTASGKADSETGAKLDYNYTYSDNTNAGTNSAKVTVTTTTDNFTSAISKDVTFSIVDSLEAKAGSGRTQTTVASVIAPESWLQTQNIAASGESDVTVGISATVESAESDMSDDAVAQKKELAKTMANFYVVDLSLYRTYNDASKISHKQALTTISDPGLTIKLTVGTQYKGKKATVKQIHDNSGTNEIITYDGLTVADDGTITLTGVTKLSEFIVAMGELRTVTFNSNGGSSVTSRSVEDGNAIGTLPTPTRSGYTFAGWFSGSTQYTASTVVTSDVTLTAHWNVASSVMYRLYNPYSGEHLYTSDATERDKVAAAGWNYEGTAWNAPSTGDPVYRLYNSHEPLGDHHYTTSKSEYDQLVSIGWTGEGVGWYSDPNKGVGLHRLYNPNAYPSGKTGAHHYTTSDSEKNNLVSLGWQYENYGWYGVK